METHAVFTALCNTRNRDFKPTGPELFERVAHRLVRDLIYNQLNKN